MNKYVVKVSSIFSNIIEIEAENEDEARVKAQEFLENRDSNDETMRHYYESTFPPEHWPVITQEKYEELREEIQSKLGSTEEKEKQEDSNIITPNNFE
jgi:hypothetical protein